MSIQIYRHPDLIAASAKIERDIAEFKARKGKIEVLPPYGHKPDPGKPQYNGRFADGTRPGDGIDMSLYYTESDIVSFRSKRGILPMGKTRWRDGIRRGEYSAAHAYINRQTPVWLRSYIDSLAAEIGDRGRK